MDGEMSVVRRETRRRWTVVLTVVALLVALPVTVSAWPTEPPKLDATVLRDRIRASAGQPHQGYAETVGALALPALPRLGQIASLLGGTTRMRAWYAAPDRWRVDVVETGSERGFYQTPDGHYTWDYGANQLTYVPAATRVTFPERVDAQDATQVIYVAAPEQPRLPRAADLLPPDLARRLLSAAAGDRVEPIAGKRVAGIGAAGLRLTSTDPHSLVGHIDIWADPRTGLPLQVEVTARGGERPVLVTRFLDVAATRPAAGVLAPPVGGDGLSVNHVQAWDFADTIFEPVALDALPDRLAGLSRQEPTAHDPASGPDGNRRASVVQLSSSAVYGTGLGRIVVLPLSSRVGHEAYHKVAAWGQRLTFARGRAALLSASLLSVMIVESGAPRQTYLLAGMVDGELLRQAGAELSGGSS